MTEFHAQQLLGLMLISGLSWVTPKRWQMDAVAISTMALLGWFSIVSLLLLCFSGLLVFLGAHYGGRAASQKGFKIACLIAYCGAQFLILRILQMYVDGAWQTLSFLGLAYYTCRHIHYLIESFSGRIQPDLRCFWHYQFFWPVMITGPIHRYNHFIRQCQRRRWDNADASVAINRIVLGYAKVVILGNYLVEEKLSIYLRQQADNLGWAIHWLDSGADWAYLYLQFSGWSDIAIGFALLMGLTIEENFNRPFLATNIIEFWQRWHITLSSWCRDYVFTPLLAVTRKPFLAVAAAMITMGLWHEVSVYYLLWGFYHASGIACCRLFQNWYGGQDAVVLDGVYWRCFSWAFTIAFIVAGAPIITVVEKMLLGVF
jgi:D-alanyl-lipoteichoic acid acyltransferase DltB (MBOAT superfamily)